MSVEQRALVIGWGLSGKAAALWLHRNGWRVTVIEDDAAAVVPGLFGPGGAATPGAEISFAVAPGPELAAKLALQSDLVVPSPGVKLSHAALVSATQARVPISSEVELAWSELAAVRSAWPADRCPLLTAITGTNGKTTVTALVTAMLRASGRWALAAGNVGFPLLDAVDQLAGGPSAATDRPVGPGQGLLNELEGAGAPVIVAEVSSFQLQSTTSFAPDVSSWLNFSPDHLDWHRDLAQYAGAKARIWANQQAGSTAVTNADDLVVVDALKTVPSGVRVITFAEGLPDAGSSGPAGASGAEWWYGPDGVFGPEGFHLAATELPRCFPHDLANTAAAGAIALAAGATPEGCKVAARVTRPPHHRLELVAQSGGVRWYDDSKATTPASVLAALRGFSSVVLIAGGRNKGLDLSPLGASVPPVRSVVAIGETAPEMIRVFSGKVPVFPAGSMAEAVSVAASVALPGDAVVLSPGCASFDWYASYAERGEHFASLVSAKLTEVADK